MTCPRCGEGLVWSSDFDFEDYGMEEEGVVSCFHCSNCGVDVEIYVPSKWEDKDDETGVP